MIPSYIGVPVDIGPHQISDYGLQTPLITSLPANDDIQEAKVTALIVDLLKSRKNPVVVFDGGKLLCSC
jgi:pyruvate decarboxylase